MDLSVSICKKEAHEKSSLTRFHTSFPLQETLALKLCCTTFALHFGSPLTCMSR